MIYHQVLGMPWCSYTMMKSVILLVWHRSVVLSYSYHDLCAANLRIYGVSHVVKNITDSLLLFL